MKLAAAVFYNSGVIPVDRKTKDNRKMFLATFEALRDNECIGVFPEGTSHHSPTFYEFKDGASWAALEFTKYLKENQDGNQRFALVVPVAITYLAKWKYRSSIIVVYGNPINPLDYAIEFEEEPKKAVKALTKRLRKETEDIAIVAPNWDILHAAETAREILFDGGGRVLRVLEPWEYITVSQELIRLFQEDPFAGYVSDLKTYHDKLEQLSLIDRDLRRLRKNTIPGLLRSLTTSSISLLLRLPFVAPALIWHTPVYYLAHRAYQSEKYMESYAQDKILGGLFVASTMYVVLFFILWSRASYSISGVFLALGITVAAALYHVETIDRTYSDAKNALVVLRALQWYTGSDSRSTVDDLQESSSKIYKELLQLLRQSELEDARSVMKVYDAKFKSK